MISICDLGPGISGFVKAALQFSNFAVIVLNPERGWIKNLQPIQDALIRMGIRYGFLINKYRGESGFLEEVKQVALRDRIPILGVIPYIDEVKNIPKSPARVNSEIDSIFAQVLESILNSIK
jgi:MinD superfamily P-loop ATPase